MQQRKDFESGVTAKRKSLAAAKVKFKEVRAKKKKIETPLLSEIENTLLEHNISAAAYHGGKLNGVDCHELIQLAKKNRKNRNCFAFSFQPRQVQ